LASKSQILGDRFDITQATLKLDRLCTIQPQFHIDTGDDISRVLAIGQSF